MSSTACTIRRLPAVRSGGRGSTAVRLGAVAAGAGAGLYWWHCRCRRHRGSSIISPLTALYGLSPLPPLTLQKKNLVENSPTLSCGEGFQNNRLMSFRIRIYFFKKVLFHLSPSLFAFLDKCQLPRGNFCP